MEWLIRKKSSLFSYNIIFAIFSLGGQVGEEPLTGGKFPRAPLDAATIINPLFPKIVFQRNGRNHYDHDHYLSFITATITKNIDDYKAVVRCLRYVSTNDNARTVKGNI